MSSFTIHIIFISHLFKKPGGPQSYFSNRLLLYCINVYEDGNDGMTNLKL